MKVITTRFLGPTNTKVSRIKATEPEGKNIVLSYRYDLSSEENHRSVAESLRDNMGWTGELFGGWARGCYAWVLDDRKPGEGDDRIRQDTYWIAKRGLRYLEHTEGAGKSVVRHALQTIEQLNGTHLDRSNEGASQ